jgi:uncharacterized protein (TIGR02996 family)
MTRPIYRRFAPDPLPIEPYFQHLPGSEVFLRAIAEEPLEDIHRLALADWLEEHGQTPRAEFIRAQCRLAQMGYGHAMEAHLHELANRLYGKHSKEWLAGLPRGGGVRLDIEQSFNRGMLECASSTAKMRRQTYELLFGSVDVRALAFHSWTGQQLRQFLEMPWLSRLVSLHLSLNWSGGGSAGDDDLLQAKSSALTGLSYLGLDDLRYDGRYSITLLESLDLPHLTELYLSGHELGEHGASALAHCPALGRVQELGLNLLDILLDEIEPFAKSPALVNLARLRLRSCGMTGRTVAALGDAAAFSRLRSLSLYLTDIGTPGIKALAASSLLRGLSSLVLNAIGLRRDGVRALARSPGVKGLRLLSLTHNEHIGHEGIRILADSPYLTSLETLDLSFVAMGKKAVDALAHAPALASVTALSLRGNRLGDAATELAGSPYLHRLSFLDLRSNKLSRNARKVVRKRWPFALM